MKQLNIIKAIVQPVAYFILLVLLNFAGKAYLDKNGGGLHITFSNDTEKPVSDEEDGGWKIIRYKLILPEKPKEETLSLASIAHQNQLLAKYNE